MYLPRSAVNPSRPPSESSLHPWRFCLDMGPTTLARQQKRSQQISQTSTSKIGASMILCNHFMCQTPSLEDIFIYKEVLTRENTHDVCSHIYSSSRTQGLRALLCKTNCYLIYLHTCLPDIDTPMISYVINHPTIFKKTKSRQNHFDWENQSAFSYQKLKTKPI